MKIQLLKLNKFSKAFLMTVLVVFVVGLVFTALPVDVNAQDGGGIKNVQGISGTTLQSTPKSTIQTAGSETSLQSFIARVIGWIGTFALTLIGWGFVVVVRLLMWIVIYNDFATSPAVNLGWSLVRDISNLFFIVILLAISIGTILKVESYNFKKLLPKLILMAVLVNFSLVIAGFILDLVQVVMLTFVAAFAGTAGEGNLIAALHIQDIVQAGRSESLDLSQLTITILLMVILTLVATAVVTVMLVVFVLRIIMLWILLVLSPLAYILAAFPQGQKYATQWWSEFTKNAIIGPVMAFFLWLTFAVVQQPDAKFIDKPVQGLGTQGSAGDVFATGDVTNNFAKEGGEQFAQAGPINDIADPDNLISYIIAIGMLMASLTLTQQMGVAGGAFAGQVYGKIRGIGMSPIRAAKWGVGKLANMAGRRADDAQAAILAKTVLAPLAKHTKWGQKAGLGELARAGGFRFRTFGDAWEIRKQRIEKQMLGDGVGGTADVLNRVLPALSHKALNPFNRDSGTAKTQIRRLSFDKRVAEEQKELEATTTDQAAIRYKLKNEVLDKNGQVKKGREAEGAAMINLLTKNHDLNEGILNASEDLGMTVDDWNSKLDDDSKLDFVTDVNGNKSLEYTANNTRAYVKHLFGNFDDSFQKEMLYKVGETGYSEKDPFLKDMAVPDYKTGGFTETTREKQFKAAQGYKAKVEGRRSTQKATRQELLQEADFATGKFDEEGNPEIFRTAFSMNPYGLIDLQNNPKGLAELHMTTAEFRKAILDSLDVIVLERNKAGDQGNTSLENGLNHVIKSTIGYEYGDREGATKADTFLPNKLGKPMSEIIDDHAKMASDRKIAILGQEIYDKNMAAKAVLRAASTLTTPSSATAVPAGTTPSPAIPRVAMSGEQDKHKATQQAIEEFGLGEDEFFASADYNEQLHQSGVDYRRHQAALAQTPEQLAKMRGVRPASYSKEKEEKGMLPEQAGVGVNFADPHIREALGVTEGQDAAYYEGENKQKATEVIANLYRQQLKAESDSKMESGKGKLKDDYEKDASKIRREFLRDNPKATKEEIYKEVKTKLGKFDDVVVLDEDDIEEKVKNLKLGIDSGKTLRIHNNASTSPRRDQKGHEVAHATLDGMNDKQKETIWKTVDKKQQQSIMADIQARYPNMNSAQQREEALAEMTGVGKGIYAPSKSTQTALNKAGVKTGGEQSLEKVNATLAELAAAGADAKDTLSKLVGVAKELGNIPISKAKSVSDFIKSTSDLVRSTVSGAKDRSKAEKIVVASGDLGRASEKRISARQKREELETKLSPEIINTQQLRSKNRIDYKEAIQQRDAAMKNGNKVVAGQASVKVNKLVEDGAKLDKVLAGYGDLVSKAKQAEGKAISELAAASRRLEKISQPASVGKAKDIKSRAGEATPTVAAVAENKGLEDVLTAAIQELGGKAEKVKDHGSIGFDDTDMIQSLGALQGSFDALASKLGEGRRDEGTTAALNSIRDAMNNTAPSKSGSGSTLDGSSVAGQLFKVVRALEGLRKQEEGKLKKEE